VKLVKYFFGMMDDDNAQYYNEQIKHFEQNSESMTDLLKQQLYVVKSSLGAINDSLSGIVYYEAKMREGLLQVNTLLTGWSFN
jgi:predicted Zn-dependent protease